MRALTPGSFHSTTLSAKIFQKDTQGADSVRLIGEDFGRQMHRRKKLPFNGITSYGAVWKKGTRKRGLDSGVSIVQSISVDKDLGRQMCRDKRRPFNGITSYGITNYGTVCRKGAIKRGLDCGVNTVQSISVDRCSEIRGGPLKA